MSDPTRCGDRRYRRYWARALRKDLLGRYRWYLSQGEEREAAMRRAFEEIPAEWRTEGLPLREAREEQKRRAARRADSDIR